MGKMKEKQGWFSLQGDKERKTDLDGKFSQTQRGRGTKSSRLQHTWGDACGAQLRGSGGRVLPAAQVPTKSGKFCAESELCCSQFRSSLMGATVKPAGMTNTYERDVDH